MIVSTVARFCTIFDKSVSPGCLDAFLSKAGEVPWIIENWGGASGLGQRLGAPFSHVPPGQGLDSIHHRRPLQLGISKTDSKENIGLRENENICLLLFHLAFLLMAVLLTTSCAEENHQRCFVWYLQVKWYFPGLNQFCGKQCFYSTDNRVFISLKHIFCIHELLFSLKRKYLLLQPT